MKVTKGTQLTVVRRWRRGKARGARSDSFSSRDWQDGHTIMPLRLLPRRIPETDNETEPQTILVR